MLALAVMLRVLHKLLLTPASLASRMQVLAIPSNLTILTPDAASHHFRSHAVSMAKWIMTCFRWARQERRDNNGICIQRSIAPFSLARLVDGTVQSGVETVTVSVPTFPQHEDTGGNITKEWALNQAIFHVSRPSGETTVMVSNHSLQAILQLAHSLCVIIHDFLSISHMQSFVQLWNTNIKQVNSWMNSEKAKIWRQKQVGWLTLSLSCCNAFPMMHHEPMIVHVGIHSCLVFHLFHAGC